MINDEYNKYGKYGLVVTRALAGLIILALISLPVFAGIRLLNKDSTDVAVTPQATTEATNSTPSDEFTATPQEVVATETDITPSPDEQEPSVEPTIEPSVSTTNPSPQPVNDAEIAASQEEPTNTGQIATTANPELDLTETGILPNTGSGSLTTTLVVATFVGLGSYKISLRRFS